MKTILVAGSKGGVGKTTVATHLAAHSALQGRRTVLADADPQGSATRWAERRAELDSAVLPIDASRSGVFGISLSASISFRRTATGSSKSSRSPGMIHLARVGRPFGAGGQPGLKPRPTERY